MSMVHCFVCNMCDAEGFYRETDDAIREGWSWTYDANGRIDVCWCCNECKEEYMEGEEL